VRRVRSFEQRAVCGWEGVPGELCLQNSTFLWGLCGRRKVLFRAGERCVARRFFFHNFFVEVGLGLAAALNTTTLSLE